MSGLTLARAGIAKDAFQTGSGQLPAALPAVYASRYLRIASGLIKLTMRRAVWSRVGFAAVSSQIENELL